MALVGYDLLVVVGVLLVVFLWGPQKLPEMARSIGQAKREFERAAKEVSSITTTSPGTSFPTVATSSPGTTESIPQDPIIVAAKSLGIVTEGKTKEAIAKEIAAKST